MTYAYELPGVDAFQVMEDPRYARLTRAGLRHLQRGFSGGALMASSIGPHKVEDFGTPETTPEGWTFYPPKEVLTIHAFRGPLTEAPGNHEVAMRLGGSLTIRPAYLEPRLVFSGGVLADHVTTYGRATRALRDKLRNGSTIDLANPEVVAVIFLAIQTTYPVTAEMLDVINRAHPWFTDDDLQPLLDAAITAPFPSPAAAG